ncbi:MAG: CHAT domain-containing protein [Chloroflexi bacterium]|nr:CHAT domain-containing protein [Chloroflexota bacterium]
MGIAPTLTVGNDTDGHIPAVVGMQYPVPDQTAITFSQMFYQFLADGEPLDAAVTKARMGVFFSGTDKVYWGIPVLFMTSNDGVIWKQ